MEKIKSVANWLDVIGLSNDFGLSVNLEQNICFGEKVVHYCNSTTLDNFLDLLETLGFKFERKTTQASEEISTEIKVGDFVKTKKQHLHGREVIFEVERILIDENTKEVFLVPSGACPISYIIQGEVSIVRKRTIEEIINEIKQLESCEFEFGEANSHIVQESDGFYKVESRYNEKSLTAIYMTRETANMYVDELNLAKKLEWIEKETQ